MSREFYGPKVEAERSINRLLHLPATGKEQDWEFELADPAKIDEMLDMLESKNRINFECKSALALLLISSMEEAHSDGKLDDEQIKRASGIFSQNHDLRDRMCFYWIELGQATDVTLVKEIAGC